MDKLKMHSSNLTEANIEKLAELFPNCITEARDAKGELKKAIDFDLLRQELSSSVVEGSQERYQLNWPGKREALLMANAPIAQTLRPCRAGSVEFDSTQNLFIEGDNLEALKLLQETYLNKVKMIYIDPPYNTGNDFIYADDFSESYSDYKIRSNQSDQDQGRLVANIESSGRFHSDWLSMMYSRIKLARNLLTEDGAIVISIDDNEVTNARKICDEIFGEKNFVACVVWQKRTSPDVRVAISSGHEYLIVFAKNFDVLKPSINRLPLTEEQKKDFRNPDNDPRGSWISSDFTAQIGHATPQQFYTITAPSGIEYTPPSGTCWKNIESVYLQKFSEGRFWFGVDGTAFPRRKTYLSEHKGRTVWTWWSNKEVGHTQEATKELKEIMGAANVFDNPKPVKLIKRLLQLISQKDSIVLDFFSGSATTAHAVMQLNAEDEGRRRFIMVQLQESCDKDSAACKEGYENIADIGKERIRRVGSKIKNEITDNQRLSQLDIGFRVLKVDTSNMKEVYYTPDAVSQDLLSDQVDNIREGRTAEDLLFQVLLDWGVDLALPISQQIIAGKTVFFVDGNALAACFETGIDEAFVKQLAGHKPLRVVFRDNGFASDSVKINVEQVFKLLSPATEIKTL